MIDQLLFSVTVVSALGCALVAGVLFAFSAFVMRALARVPPPQGIAAMQSINATAINVWFLGVFLGTAVACAILAVSAFLMWDTPHPAYVRAGSLWYLIGTFLVTALCNVPRNDALAAVDAESAEGAALWAGYLRSWTAWNHVRTAAALTAAVSLTLAL